MDINSTLTKERILRLDDVKQRTGLSRSTIYLHIQNGLFPQNIHLGARCVGWLESEIDSWIMDRITQSRSNGLGIEPVNSS